MDPSLADAPPLETTKKKNLSRLVELGAFLLVLILVGVVIYVWQHNIILIKERQLSDQEQQINTLTMKLASVSAELAAIKNPPTPPYCNQGKVYENTTYKYKACLTGSWSKNPTLSTDEKATFTKDASASASVISIQVSTDYIEDALNKYAKDIYVDTTDRSYRLDSAEGIQVTGTVPPHNKRAITVFTINNYTFAIVMESPKDSGYASTLAEYKEIVESIKFAN